MFLNKCVFLDRDGTINIDRHHLLSEKDIFIFPGTKEALLDLQKKKFKIIIISNQSCVGRNYISLTKLENINRKIETKIYKKKLIDDFFICPHHPYKGIKEFRIQCNCRKPRNGLIEIAIKKWKVDRKKSFMIGDKMSDYLAAKRSKINFFFKSKVNLNLQLKSIFKKFKFN